MQDFIFFKTLVFLALGEVLAELITPSFHGSLSTLVGSSHLS
jgi:hypothetical protein